MMKSGGLAPVPEHLIRKDYVSTVGTTASAASAAAIYAVDPLTGQQVRVDDGRAHADLAARSEMEGAEASGGRAP